MGTRSLTRINTSTGSKIINLYRQFDGYPTGHGKDLFNFLNGFEIVNGYTGREGPKAANGAGCLAAQLVAHFKMRKNETEQERDSKLIGEFYLYPVESADCGQDYEYVVTVTEASFSGEEKSSIRVEVIGYGGSKFSGTVAEFGDWCDKEDEDD
jgi:hypothetical protein